MNDGEKACFCLLIKVPFILLIQCNFYAEFILVKKISNYFFPARKVMNIDEGRAKPTSMQMFTMSSDASFK